MTVPTEVIDRKTREKAVAALGERNVVLPTFAELADPRRLPEAWRSRLAGVDPDAPDAANLFRVHWYNAEDRRAQAGHPVTLELPPELTGVSARILVVLGRCFPMIGAHKVLAAYSCLVPRLVTGQFDPTRHRAIWPSTGNYCRGGVAISRILGCHGVAVLPEHMSEERFRWLREWVADPADIIRTPGSESNVKEIYDKCRELEGEPDTDIVNQFSEFGNYLGHYAVTAPALQDVFETARAGENLALAAFVAGTGSAGTLGAGDYLKRTYGSRIVAVEPLECPTLLMNGYGEHNIQGIGDKHVPLIHNVANTDAVVGVSDAACDELNVLFNTEVGERYLTGRRKLPKSLVRGLRALGISGIANVLASIKLARRLGLDETQAIVTVATDGAELYESEREKTLARHFPEGFDEVSAAEVYGRRMMGVADDHVLELTEIDRRRIFNLGYYTWVEQQGVELAAFEARRARSFWTDLQSRLPALDELIRGFNEELGARQRKQA